MKQFSPASERNREPILAVLRDVFADVRRVLEIGSGTGQHAVHFAAALPHLVWQTSDLPRNHASINAWRAEASLPNLPPPLALDVGGAWPQEKFDALFTANTCHIMAWEEVRDMFSGFDQVGSDDAVLCIYGPFNYGGKFTSASNAAFDASLRQQAPHMGLRDMEEVNRLARTIGFQLQADHPMPANNRLLVWRRGSG